MILKRPWHDRHMNDIIGQIAASLSRQHCERPRLIVGADGEPLVVNGWRPALRLAGLPVMELNQAPTSVASNWLETATAFSAEFLMPVVVLGVNVPTKNCEGIDQLGTTSPEGCRSIEDADWLRTRQVAVTHAVETSPLNQEFRRNRERRGWIRIGWQKEADLAEGNGLLLAWSSPLPLRRIRDFAARCPEITLIGPDAESIAREVAAQGISVTGWRFAVK